MLRVACADLENSVRGCPDKRFLFSYDGRKNLPSRSTWIQRSIASFDPIDSQGGPYRIFPGGGRDPLSLSGSAYELVLLWRPVLRRTEEMTIGRIDPPVAIRARNYNASLEIRNT